MKKAILIVSIVILLFLALLYWSLSSTAKVFETPKIVGVDDISNVNFKDYDSIYIKASTLYKADEIKKIMQGEQYRKAWSTSVKVPIVFLDTLNGGMKIIKEGGGKQTHSLKLESRKGIRYTLRGINKDPKALIPEYAKTFGLENIIVDGISAQHPYAAVVVAELANQANILHTSPEIFFVPKQKALDKYNEKYGNRLFLLEYETESKVNWTNYKNVSEILETEELQELKKELKEKLSIDKKELIRVRLFDLLIGDWDRHSKQWGWAIEKIEGNYLAHPIAGDRDNAFFNVDGIIPTLMSNEYVVPELRPFTKEINFLPGLVYPFDRYFLYNTEEELFIDEAKKLQELLNDEVIYKSLKKWPKEIYDLDGESIALKIINRRKELIDYAIGFKKIIDKKGFLQEPLKGSEDLNLETSLSKCFECQ